MATVKISGALLDETKNIIEEMRRKEQAQVESASHETILTPDDPRIINRFIPPEHLSTFMTMPKEWMESHGAMGMTLRMLLKPEDPGSGVDIAVRLNFNGRSCFLPHSVHSNYHDAKKMKGDHSTGKWPEFDKLVEKIRWDTECVNRWNEVQDKVLGFLKSFSTLNQAVKAWPAVKLYIGKDYIDRMETKVERTANEINVPTINYDELTAAAVAARMGV